MTNSLYLNLKCVCIIFCFLFSSVGYSNAKYDVFPFIVATNKGPEKLDPVDAYDSDSIDTIMQICEGLYRYNYSSSEMECIPCLAEYMGYWNIAGDELTVPLKEGVTFHNGYKFNASSVKWNFDRLQYWTYGFDVDDDGDLDSSLLGTASMSLFKQKDTVILNHTEIIDEYTIKFILNLPCVIWEKLLGFVACFIVLPDLDDENIPYYGHTFFNRITINDRLIGTGPFILTEYDLNNRVVFDYYPDYHITWRFGHIRRIIYLIIPDDETSSLALLNHEVHWGGVIDDYQAHFDADPDLMSVEVKRTTVYFIQMNLYNMPRDIRYASSFAFNFAYYLAGFLTTNYELHGPIPDGMQYHKEGFEGEPEYDVDKARDILLNSTDAGITANITANNLGPTNTTAEWRAVAESDHPVAWYNFTRYSSNTVLRIATQLNDNLKDIGIRVEILPPMTWANWVQNYLEDPAGHHLLAYSFGGWAPDYNDPINMIEPLYGTNASSNCFGLNNATWNQKLIDTYSLTGEARRTMFEEIQQDFCLIHVPSFYIRQAGGTMSFNRYFVDKDSIGDLYNIFADLYWFNVLFFDLYYEYKFYLDVWKINLICICCVGALFIIQIGVYLLKKSRRTIPEV